MSRTYTYVGTASLSSPKALKAVRTLIATAGDLLAALRQAKPVKRGAPAVFTYIVDVNGSLWVADRHSEHVACARGGDVLSAGEMTVEFDSENVAITDVTNQSTGYCPEPESWPAVATALDNAGVSRPDEFTRAFLFRLCEGCGQTNVVKEGDFTCAVCGAKMKQEWNFSHDTRQR